MYLLFRAVLIQGIKKKDKKIRVPFTKNNVSPIFIMYTALEISFTDSIKKY